MQESNESGRKLTARTVLFRTVRTILVAYILVLMVLTFLQRQLLYQPRTADALNVAEFKDVMRIYPKSRDVELTCDDGTTIRGWLLHKSDPANASHGRRPLVLFFHGNAGNRSGRGNWYRLLAQAGADVLAIDYPGYGDSGGKMSEHALELSADATWNFATSTLGYQPSEMVVLGSSLGGAAAVYVSARTSEAGNAPAALVVVASFSSMVDVAASHYPWLPIRAVLVDRYPSEDRISKVSSPIVLMHGDEDTIVHQRFGQRLFEAAPEQSANGTVKQWLSLSGVGHNDILGGAGHQIQAQISTLLLASVAAR